MKQHRIVGWGALFFAAIASGCSSPTSLFESKRIDYRSAGKLPPLEIPPDLTAPSADDRYAVPDTKGQSSATFSNYNKERAGAPTQGAGTVLPGQDKVTIERAGNQRWLSVKAPADEIWPVVKDFWQEIGFIVKMESPESGIMETDWAENRAKIPQDIIRSTIGKVFDDLYSTAERDKFRTRLEHGAQPGTTDIFISHRGMYEVLVAEGKTQTTRWQPRPADTELEAEMLRRLMLRFGVEDSRARVQVAEKAADQAKLTKAGDGSSQLALNDAFDRAWRRVGLALDRVGFTVEDRDRSKGLYFVRYADRPNEVKKEEGGILSKLAFWRSDNKVQAKAEQYRIAVQEAGEATQVQVLDPVGAKAKPEVTDKILALLFEQLK